MGRQRKGGLRSILGAMRISMQSGRAGRHEIFRVSYNVEQSQTKFVVFCCFAHLSSNARIHTYQSLKKLIIIHF